MQTNQLQHCESQTWQEWLHNRIMRHLYINKVTQTPPSPVSCPVTWAGAPVTCCLQGRPSACRRSWPSVRPSVTGWVTGRTPWGGWRTRSPPLTASSLRWVTGHNKVTSPDRIIFEVSHGSQQGHLPWPHLLWGESRVTAWRAGPS